MKFFFSEIREVHTSPENKKEECRENIVKNVFPFYLEKFDKQVKENGGYFVGGKVIYSHSDGFCLDPAQNKTNFLIFSYLGLIFTG